MRAPVNCILLVDDDLLTNVMNNAVLHESNFSNYIIKKQSALSALRYLSESAGLNSKSKPFPDLIFLDIVMPQISGWGFIKIYKTIRSTFPNEPKIFLLSSVSLTQNYQRISDEPVIAGVLQKPLTAEVISSVINQYFHSYIKI